MKGQELSPDLLNSVFKCDSKHNNYFRLDCWGEGSCFFHSVALLTVQNNRVIGDQVEYLLQFGKSTYRVRVPLITPFVESFRQVGPYIRTHLARDLQKNPDLWSKFTREVKIDLARTDKPHQTRDQVIHELQSVEEWADIWTIQYTAWRLKLNLLFINPSMPQEPLYCGVENFSNGEDTLFIYWSNGSHFEPVVKVEHNHAIRTFGQDHIFLECLRKQYKKGCPLTR